MRPKYLIVVLGLALAMFSPLLLGNTCAPIIWTPGGDPLYRFNQGDKAGFIDQTGKIVVPAILDISPGSTGGHFHDGLILMSFDGVYFDTHGKRAFERKLYRGWDFSEGLAVAMLEERGLWGYINTKGEFAISPRFASSRRDYVWPFQDGFAKVEVGGKFGFIDHTGEFAIQPMFLQADSFSDGMARVVVGGRCLYSSYWENPCGSADFLPIGSVIPPLVPCRYTFADRTGRLITDERYTEALAFSEGLAAVQIGGLWGYIDKKGNLVIPARFKRAQRFSEGLAAVAEDGRYGFIDQTGNYVIKPRFDQLIVGPFVDGLAPVGNPDSEMWFIDRRGQQAFPEKFVVASPFYKGLAHVQLITGKGKDQGLWNGTFAYINPQGKVVFTYVVDQLGHATLPKRK